MFLVWSLGGSRLPLVKIHPPTDSDVMPLNHVKNIPRIPSFEAPKAMWIIRRGDRGQEIPPPQTVNKISLPERFFSKKILQGTVQRVRTKFAHGIYAK